MMRAALRGAPISSMHIPSLSGTTTISTGSHVRLQPQHVIGKYHSGPGVVVDMRHTGECLIDWQVPGYTPEVFHASQLTLVDTKPAAPKPTAVPKEIDLKPLDALVIDQEVKNEIISVLKQHKHSTTLFEKWGLGKMMEYGRGMTFLFYGPPGTGKTHAASCMAKALGTELLSIGQAEIQSSEPGAANRNIQEAFAEAKSTGKVLFIDECDSLITNRAGLGMILAGEVNTLLTEIEKCEGVVILATNRVEHMDAALERRISLIAEFPAPDRAAREAIWEKMLPKEMPRSKEVEIAALADHALTGGQIKNVVLQAARLALASGAKQVEKSHFDAAIARVLASKNLMGTASRYRQDRTTDYTLKTDVDSFLDKELNA